MTDREKLVEIVCQAMQEVDCIGHCNHPPCYQVHHVVDELISHGVTAKAMQRPLTVEEASGTNEPVWMEYITGRVFVCDLAASPGWNGIYDAYVIGGAVPKPLPKNHYGKSWRCWAEKPTEAERRNAKWEE